MSDIPMLEVLLKRMETHPEEFVDGIDSRKWGNIIESYSDCLTQPERDKVAQGIKNARRAMLNQKIMQKLAGEGEPELKVVDEAPQNYTHPYNSKPSFPSEEELEAMHKIFVQNGLARSREEQEELAKKHYTLEQIKIAMKKASS